MNTKKLLLLNVVDCSGHHSFLSKSSSSIGMKRSYSTSKAFYGRISYKMGFRRVYEPMDIYYVAAAWRFIFSRTRTASVISYYLFVVVFSPEG